MNVRASMYFNPAEWALMTYLLLTGILIILFQSQLPEAGFQLVFRITIILLITFLSWIENKGLYQNTIEFIRYFLPLLALIYLYKETDLLNNFIFKENLDPILIRMEEYVFGCQPSLEFAEHLSSNAFAEIMYFGYFSYYLMLIGVPLYMFLKKDHIVASKVMFMIICSFLMYYLIFIIFPAGGPQFYFTNWPALPEGYLFGPLMRFIQSWGEAPTAAFPSSHVSICLMLIILCFSFAGTLVKFVLPVGFLLVLSTVYIRAHYVLDIVAALLVTPLIFLLADLMMKKTVIKYSN